MTENYKTLALRRLDEARILQNASMHSGAYYLAGYAVECALKACILKSMKRYHMPDKKTVNESHTHDLTKLLELAGLKAAQAAAAGADPVFGRNWAFVKDWNEGSRYETWSEQDAADMIAAVSQRRSGVLTWTKKRW